MPTKTCCPWCGSKKHPVRNDYPDRDATDEQRTDLWNRTTTWHQRNPWKCPDCGEVGGGEDWGMFD